MGQNSRVGTHSVVCPVHVGRDEEIKHLAACADRLAPTLVAGEAGIGKSRLVAEAVRLADERGLSQLIGQCSPEPTVPFAAFVTALRRRTRTLQALELSQLFQGPALLAAALLPEATSLVMLPSEAPRQEDLFAAVWHVFNRLSRPQGALLVLEDLHWADTDSLQLFSYLARERSGLDLWLVGTYRSDELHRRHPLTSVLAELHRLRAHDQIELQPLDRDDLREMISTIFDHTDVSDELLESLLLRTEGNPFFLEELLKVLLERGDVYQEGGEWTRRDLSDIHLPETLRETLLTRGRSLTPSELEVFRLAAIAGVQLDIPVLAAAAALDPSAVEDAIAHGLDLQLLVERRDGLTTTYSFRHALTREAFADELLGPQRQRAHALIASAIAEVHAANLNTVAAELADHFSEAGDTDRALEHALQAARAAAASYALDEAGRRYAQALQLMPVDSDGRLPILIEAIELAPDAPDRRLVTSFGTEARALARTRNDAVSEARVLAMLAMVAWNEGDSRHSLELVSEAADLAKEKGDFFEATIIASLVRMLARSDRPDEALSRLRRGIELAERSNNARALSRLHLTRLMATPYGPEFDQTLDAATRAARAANDGPSELSVTTTAGYVTLWCGDFNRSRRLFEAALDLNDRYSPNDDYTEAGYIWLLSLTGEYIEALRRADAGKQSRVPSEIVRLTARYEVAERQGDSDAGAVAEALWKMADRTGEAQRSVPALSARARHALLSEGVDIGSRLAWQCLDITTANSRGTGSHWLFSPDFARALAEDQRVDELTRWSETIRALTFKDPTPHNQAAEVLTSGHLATAQNQSVAARSLLSEASERYRDMLCPAREAEASIALAELEWRAGDTQAAGLAATRALEIARLIGASALEDRAVRALRKAESSAVLVTVLFTDIVGSTERLSSVGDRAWSTLLERHHAFVGKELERFRGRQIDTTGDGVFASFESPAQGIRCAFAIRAALARAGIEVRAGLHTGECQAMGTNLTGLTVHIAARVSAIAEAGEVLVSRTVRDLVAGSGFSFIDRGVHQLKGVPGEWAVFAVAG